MPRRERRCTDAAPYNFSFSGQSSRPAGVASGWTATVTNDDLERQHNSCQVQVGAGAVSTSTRFVP